MSENSENTGHRLLYSFESIFPSRAVFVKRELVDSSYLIEVHKGSGKDKKLHQGLLLQSQTYKAKRTSIPATHSCHCPRRAILFISAFGEVCSLRKDE